MSRQDQAFKLTVFMRVPHVSQASHETSISSLVTRVRSLEAQISYWPRDENHILQEGDNLLLIGTVASSN